MKRFHIAIAVRDLEASIREYSQRLGQPATVIVQHKYAMWRTDLLNFSINQNPDRVGELRHVGFEDDTVQGFSSSRDGNGIEWELFSPAAQDQKIVETYGRPAVAKA
jgi:catechol 2,3-dioxygenase-like lactoylglutathione lyase family enzyme